ncbi:dual oxidase maturation factor 1-like isoform X2 [Macrobrachium rosenbergii]|uniref:dual oxidase maturation factor 1-like isoform X2 n=1 Tax=Macrobrachium rosenbergii TaxID=79674 RepID=UPI0034D432A8
MGAHFTLGRVWPFPSIYPDWKTPVTQDVLCMGWVAAFFALLLPFYLVIPASSYKLSRTIRVTFFMLLALFIMLCNFGQDWEVGFIRTRTPYKAGTADQIDAEIGVRLGLRSVNITLKGKPQNESSSLAGETINYNERFSWVWAQGRPGFGPYAGHIQRDFRAAQQRGSPYPILWVAEYFTFDGDGIRFGRHYRTAGWYSHILLWAAFPAWVMTVLLFKMVIRYAALALVLTGVLLLIPAVIWSCYRNPIELEIPFEGGILTTKFGWCFYLALLTEPENSSVCQSPGMIEMDLFNNSATWYCAGLPPTSPLSKYSAGATNPSFELDSCGDAAGSGPNLTPGHDSVDLCDDVFAESPRTKTEGSKDHSPAPETED